MLPLRLTLVGGVIMRFVFGFLLALLAGAATANELNNDYSEMGRMSVQVGDRELELVIPLHEESGDAFAEQKLIMGSFLTINTAAQEVDDDGEPSGILVQVTLQKQGSSLTLLSAELFDDRGFDEPMAMGADGGAGTLTSHSFDNDVLTAVIEGTFVRLTGYMSGEPVADSDEQPLPAVIQWEVTLPPLE